MKKAQNLSVPVETIASKLLKLKDSDTERLKMYRQKFPNVTAFLNSAFPHLGANAPRRLRESAVMGHTTHHLKAAERRLRACATCPESGGACATDRDGHKPGLQPRWGKDEKRRAALQLIECDRWAEWIARQRVMEAGVEPRLAGWALRDVKQHLNKKTAPLIGTFIEECRLKSDPNLVVAGKFSTEVAVALLRSLTWAIPDLKARYVRCPRLASPLKQHYADPKGFPHPTKPLMGIDLLIMVETNVYEKADWLDDELCELVYTRYLNNRPTLLATEQTDAARLGHHYFKTAVSVCYAP